MPKATAVAIGALCLLLLAACSSDSRPAGEGSAGARPKPQRVSKQGGLSEPTPASFTRAELSGDGRTVEVFFPVGEDGCVALADVETTFVGDDTLRVTVLLGTSQETVRRGGACTAIGIPSVTTVRLPRSATGRTIVDGARP